MKRGDEYNGYNLLNMNSNRALKNPQKFSAQTKYVATNMECFSHINYEKQ